VPVRGEEGGVIKKQVWRYWCDYCGKAGLSGGHMKNHELHCTKNPNRYCRMCHIIEFDAKPLPDLLEIMKPAINGWEDSEWAFEGKTYNEEKMKEILADCMKRLREAADGCPACILAAIRQSNIPVPCTDFDFKKECESHWSDHNSAHADHYDGY
jgi:hypothetical protein